MYSLFSSRIVPKGHYSVIPKIKFLLFFIINYIVSEVVRKVVAIDENYNFANFEEKTELKRILFATWFLVSLISQKTRANYKGNRLLQLIVNQGKNVDGDWVKPFCVGFNIDYIHDSAIFCSNILHVLHHSLTMCTISTFVPGFPLITR